LKFQRERKDDDALEEILLLLFCRRIELDYGKGYQYAHDEEGKVANMDCLPDSLKGRTYFQPTQEGREKQLAARMEEIRRIRAARRRSE